MTHRRGPAETVQCSHPKSCSTYCLHDRLRTLALSGRSPDSQAGSCWSILFKHPVTPQCPVRTLPRLTGGVPLEHAVTVPAADAEAGRRLREDGAVLSDGVSHRTGAHQAAGRRPDGADGLQLLRARVLEPAGAAAGEPVAQAAGR